MKSCHIHKPTRGFSLIEMAIVMVIVGILIGVGMPMARVYIEQYKHNEDKANIRALKELLIGYALARGGLPSDAGNVIPVNNIGMRGINPYNNDIQYYANALLTEAATAGDLTTLCDTARNILDGTTVSTTPAICNVVADNYTDCVDSTVQLFVIVSPGSNRAMEHENGDGDAVFENPSKKPNSLNDYDDVVASFGLAQLVHQCQST